MRLFRSLLSGAAFLSLVAVGVLSSLPGFSQQVSTDNTVGTTIRSNSSNNTFVIEGGSLRSNSLFHSFETFSPADWSVVFDLSDNQYSDVNLVINRTTGQQNSYINGGLQILGGNRADLLLVNPAGISFGPKATLQIEGSFLASTAQSILFGENVFDTQNPQAVPLLTVSTPTGLQMGERSQGISYQGSGHSLIARDSIIAPYQPTALPTGLVTNPGKSITFVGNGIALNGGTLSSPGGRADLLSVSSGLVGLEQNVTLTSEDAIARNTFSDISLSNRALLDVSGTDTGKITLQGQNINLSSNAVIFSQNRGTAAAGDITIAATGRFSLSSQNPEMNIVTAIASDGLASGRSANVYVESDSLLLSDGSAIASRTFGSGEGGDVSIRTGNLEIIGFAQQDSKIFSRFGGNTVGSGRGGDVSVIADRLSLQEGGYIGTATLLSSGQGGDVSIRANAIDISGATPTGELSVLTAVSIGGSGDAGNLSVETERLTLSDSGSIATSSFGAGSSGNISVAATEQIKISGRRGTLLESSIRSDVLPPPPNYQQLVGNNQVQTGDSGELDIATGSLRLEDSGLLSVANSGSGQAGTLKVSANEIVLRNGEITAVTASGQGGNIFLASATLRASQNSLIQSTSLGTGNGGNISIKTDFAIGQNNSDIVANAVNGRGGNISISARRLFGFRPSSQLTSENDITASSELGVAGNIKIADANLDVNPEIAALPMYFSDADNQVAAECAGEHSNHFVASGRGGLAVRPSDRITNTRTWIDIRPSFNQTAQSPTNSRKQKNSSELSDDLLEAIGWSRSAEGTIQLVASSNDLLLQNQSAQCLKRDRSPS